jgi:hypothetical protein
MLRYQLQTLLLSSYRFSRIPSTLQAKPEKAPVDADCF